MGENVVAEEIHDGDCKPVALGASRGEEGVAEVGPGESWEERKREPARGL